MPVASKKNSGKIKLLISLLLLSLNLYALGDPNDFIRVINQIPSKQTSLFEKAYAKWRMEINPFVPTPYLIINDKVTDKKTKQVIFNANYTTEELGLRIIPGNNKKLSKHLIITGDSNTFGVGCADNETLPYYLSLKFPDMTTYNFAQAGTGPHSTLRFLEIFKVSDFAAQKEGALIIDFHFFFVRRAIGSKSFLAWGDSTPQYTLNDKNVPVYQGPYSQSTQAKFYRLLNKLPMSDKLFPELPRIGNRHIDLTARIVLAIKNKFLEQTSKNNKFFVFIHPEFKYHDGRLPMSKEDSDILIDVAKEMKDLGIDVITFNDKEILDLPHFNVEGHLTPEAHKNYAQMIYDKIKDKI